MLSGTGIFVHIYYNDSYVMTAFLKYKIKKTKLKLITTSFIQYMLS